VAALRPTGAVLVGKAAMHEIGVMPFGTNAAQVGRSSVQWVNTM
jgi:Asp-tRNA(Asn)/Glu-tRNA(Gln) amidotransferase A subunit family amidase